MYGTEKLPLASVTPVTWEVVPSGAVTVMVTVSPAAAWALTVPASVSASETELIAFALISFDI